MTHLADLAKLCAEATPGPWRSRVNDQKPYKHVQFDQKSKVDAMYTTSPLDATDADFIAAARTWLPKLVAVAEAARAVMVGPAGSMMSSEAAHCYGVLRDALAALDGETST